MPALPAHLQQKPSLDIHLMGICGTGVGALAGLLKQQGHQVRGSDENVYPPMSDKLKEWAIPVASGYGPQNLEPRPDVVVVGNVIRAVNPEVVAVQELGIPMMSMPEAVAHFGIGKKHALVVTGTHGKTSITAMLTHVLREAGRDPSFLVGGALVGVKESFDSTDGAFFVVEGDEYDTAFWDKRAKFHHYRPSTVIITSLEFDHADIFDSLEDLEREFADLIAIVPPSGHLVVAYEASRARRLIDIQRSKMPEDEWPRLTVYSTEPQADAQLHYDTYSCGPDGLRGVPMYHDKPLPELAVPLWGRFGAANSLAVLAALRGVGVEAEAIAAGLATYRGVHRRLEVCGEPGGVTLVDDFAHHPTAVLETLAAARKRWPQRRLWALFEPRSATSRRNVFQDAYVDAFAGADQVVLTSHERLAEVDESERFNPERLAAALRERDVGALFEPTVDGVAARVATETQAGDVVLMMSNGAFGGLRQKLLTALGERKRESA